MDQINTYPNLAEEIGHIRSTTDLCINLEYNDIHDSVIHLLKKYSEIDQSLLF